VNFKLFETNISLSANSVFIIFKYPVYDLNIFGTAIVPSVSNKKFLESQSYIETLYPPGTTKGF
jgi:hypothetical protein